MFLVLLATNAEAASLAIRVTDSTGAPLPGVTAEAGRAACVTARDGTCTLDVAPGVHEVAFRLSQFKSVTRRASAPGDVEVTMQLAASADVVVTANGGERSASDGVVTAAEIARRPMQRAGSVLETVPGMAVSQHSGEGKANQYYLRGFNLDHGTDFAITVAGVPVNMPTHAHGQGYADVNFVIPELIGGVEYRKGPYYAEEGDFASAGAAKVNYLTKLERPVALLQGGTFGYGRAVVAASHPLGRGTALFALETMRNEGPWVRPDDYRRTNGVLRYTVEGGQSGLHGQAGSPVLHVTAMVYAARWNATDQIPERAVRSGVLSRFGLVDGSDGGETSRYSLAAEWQRGASQVAAYAMQYRLNLFSNFTYFLDDPLNGDQFEQADDRLVAGLSARHRWLGAKSETVAGLQLRHDAIANVGLYHTAQRRRLETIREDGVRQTSTAVYAQNRVQWRDGLRTIAGLRADRYRFDVSGATATDTLLSPKLTLILGPWKSAELYLNAGRGFHSNDARAARGGTPLVATRGAELGLRARHVTAALWRLDAGSELVFVGDAGTTEEGSASQRYGVEVTSSYPLTGRIAVDAQYAWSHARFRNGGRIPGAVEAVTTAGIALTGPRGFTGELRYRYVGPRPLVEDNSVRSDASSLVSARVSWALTANLRVDADGFNLLDAKVSDVDYFYTSRLRHEPEPVEDVHFHPVEGRSVRIGVTASF